MSLFSYKGIKNLNQGDYSYAHSVLQSLCCLDCSRQFLQISRNDIQNNPNYLLTNAVFDLLNCLYNGQEGNSQNVLVCFINSYKRHSAYISTKNVLNQDPFHFIFFLLNFLHLENNKVQSANNNINLDNQILSNQQDDSFMFKLFQNFWIQTQNSIISNNFFSIERYKYLCPKCQMYYSYGMKNLFRINVNNAINWRNSQNPRKVGTNINLEDCLNYYFGENKKTCKNCGINNIDKKTDLIIPAEVLIINFERPFHSNKGDIDFETNINVNQYISKSRTARFNLKTNYILKSCISFYNNKYYADCYCNFNNNNYAWYRYMDDYIKILGSIKEIYDYEPQLLIYELDNKFNNGNDYSNSSTNLFNSESNSLNNQFNNNFNQFNFNSKFNNNYNENNNNNQFNNNNFNNNQFNNNINNNNNIQMNNNGFNNNQQFNVMNQAYFL